MTATAVITRNFATAEAAPAHFHLHGWASTGTGPSSQWKFAWTVSGGSEHDGVYTGANLGLVFETPGSYQVTLEIEDGAGLSSRDSVTLTVTGQPAFDDAVYVAAAGDDVTGDGSPGLPYQTFGRAVTHMEAQRASQRDRCIYLKRGETFTQSATVALGGYAGSFYVQPHGSFRACSSGM